MKKKIFFWEAQNKVVCRFRLGERAKPHCDLSHKKLKKLRIRGEK